LKKHLIIITSITVISLAAGSILFVNLSRASKANKLIYQCSTYIKENNYTEAKRVFNEGIALARKTTSFYLDIAKQYEEKGMQDSAFVVIKKGCENTKAAEMRDKLEAIKALLPVTSIEQIAPHNSKYSLPDKVALKIDNAEEYASVKWDAASINTDKIADYKINGIAEEYERKVVLNLRIEPIIEEIKDSNRTIRQGTQFALPTTLNAEMSDGTFKNLPAAWNPVAVDINTPGVYEFEGSVEGFTGKTKLVLTINPLEQEINMSDYLKINLDNFFSSFSEAGVKTFEDSKISNVNLINFGIMHIKINDWWRINNLVVLKASDPNHGYVKSSDVDNACYQYFGKKPTTHNSIKLYPFDGNYYKFKLRGDQPITFSQINKLIDIGDNFYRAEINIYEALSGFTGDLHGAMIDWKKSHPYNLPKLKKKMTAKIKKITEAGKERYILISCVEIKK
jgi:hypothetical protein